MYIHLMAQMVRKQIYLTREQNRRLRRAARMERRAEAELIREAVDRHLAPTVIDAGMENDTLWNLIGITNHGPSDLSAEVDHYLYGRARK